MNTSFDTDVVAALLWDRPKLRESDDPGAKAFVHAFDGLPLETIRDVDLDVSSSLMEAAKTVESAFRGRTAEAITRSVRLSNHQDRNRQLLGLMLSCWLGEPTPEDWHRARELTETEEDPQTRAHLFTKLFIYAFDQGIESAREYLFRAKDLSSGALDAQLSVVASNLYGSDLVWGARYEPDDLVDLPWIEETTLAAVTNVLSDMAKSQAESLGGGVVHYGSTPINKLAIADSQATWCGAYWKRGRIRKLLSAALVATGEKDEPDWARNAVSLWISSVGQNIDAVVEYVEPHFAKDTADRILNEDLRSEAETRGGRPRFVDAARAMWDLITEQTAGVLLDLLPATESEHPHEQRIRALWAMLALRIPKEWDGRYVELPPKARGLIAEHFTGHAPRFLGRSAIPAVESLLPATAGNLDFLTSAAEELGLEIDLTQAWLEAQPNDVARLLRADASLVPQDETDRAVFATIEQCRKDLQQASAGSFSFGGSDDRQMLGLLASHGSDYAMESATSMLIETAMSSHARGRQRLGALQGLYELVISERLDRQDVDVLRFLSTAPDPEPFLGVEADLLKAYQAAIRSQFSPSEAVASLVALARSRSDEARFVAISAVGVLKDPKTIDARASALLGALYDPEPYVVARAISRLDGDLLELSQWSRAFTDRILELTRSTRMVRRSLANLVRGLREAGMDDFEILRAETLLKGDRSWDVASQIASVPSRQEES